MTAPETPRRHALDPWGHGVPQHAVGKGRYRQEPTKISQFLPAAAVAGGALLGIGVLGLGLGPLLGGGDQHADAQTEPLTSQTVIMELTLSEPEAQILNVARTTCDNLNLGALDGATIDAAAQEALAAYQHLQASITEVSHVSEQALVLEGVPGDVVDAYRSHEIPMRKLVAAAQSVTRLDRSSDPEPAAETLDEVALPKVTAPLSEDSVAQLKDATERLDQAVQVLPVEDRVAVAGEGSVDPASLTDEELERVLAVADVPSFRVEQQKRFAASLPDMSAMTNGYIDESLLCPIPWADPYYRVLCVGLPSLVALNEEFKASFGHDLAIQSAYRSYEDQVQVHAASPDMTTLPGTSNHSWGLAIDFDIDNYRSYDNPEVAWLVENGPRFGWRNPTLEAFETAAQEPWHFEFGTSYPAVPGGGFNGPTPEVEYVISLPQGSRTQTLLSEMG